MKAIWIRIEQERYEELKDEVIILGYVYNSKVNVSEAICTLDTKVISIPIDELRIR